MADRWQCMVCGYTHKGGGPPTQCPSCGAPFTAFQKREKDPKARFRNLEIADPRPDGFRYVIIGNSAAGRYAARAIQALHPAGHVSVISEESASFYSRPLLPDFIGGMSREDFFGVGAAFSEEGLELITGEAAARVDTDGKLVTCAGGREVPYDALLLATGSAPIQIPWPGSDAEGIAYFRTFADAERIAQLAREGRHAVVVGGGLLGLEFVRAFHAAGLKITHLVRESYVGAPALDLHGGPLVRAALESLGVELALEEEVESFGAEDGRVCCVKTNKGRTIECDLVGIAVGARPRLELAADAGLDTDRGIVVNRRFETSTPDVYAAGDVAQAFDRVWGEPRVNTSWRNSQEQGEQAGIFMAGGAGEYAGAVAANFQLAAGLPFFALGIANPPEGEQFDTEFEVDEDKQTYRKLVTRDGVLVGACLIGDLGEAGELERAVREAHAPAPEHKPPADTTRAAADEQQRATTQETAMHKMTEDNVKDALAGESQAHIKYLNFAEKAQEEGKANVARVFRAASYSEQVHATRHLEVLDGIGDTADNLDAAIGGESFEVAEMYPAYIAVAIEQDEPEAQESFNWAMEAEKVHHELYERSKEAVASGADPIIEDIWVCPFCGFTMEGDPPGKCPLCSTPKKQFVKF